LRYEAAKPIADDEWRSFKLANNLFVMIDNVVQTECGEAARIAAKLLDVAFHAGPASGDDAITFVRVVSDPLLPTERGHPQAVDENNRGDIHCGKREVRASDSPGNSSLIGGRKLNAARLLMSRGSCL
jgi:hypothetical protein